MLLKINEHFFFAQESETQVGNDIKNIELIRWLLKTQFDKNVVTQFDVQV